MGKFELTHTFDNPRDYYIMVEKDLFFTGEIGPGKGVGGGGGQPSN